MISDGRFLLKLERGKKKNVGGFYIKSSPFLGSTKLTIKYSKGSNHFVKGSTTNPGQNTVAWLGFDSKLKNLLRTEQHGYEMACVCGQHHRSWPSICIRKPNKNFSHYVVNFAVNSIHLPRVLWPAEFC